MAQNGQKMAQNVELIHDKEDPKLWDWPLEHEEGGVKIYNTPDKFHVGLHVQEFTPKEIQVTVVNDEVVINCNHEFRNNDHGRVTRSVSRAYKLPDDVNKSTLKSKLSDKGILDITAEKKK